jgi:site-specific DNA recombinase
MVLRAVLYLRVSTVRQAEKDLSIPDQRRQAQAYCSAKGWQVVAEYEEAGASATDDRRPAFQRMIGDACGPTRPFDMVLVHSYSRFFRDAFKSEFYIRRLAKHGVKLVSVTQESGDDPHSQMIRQIMALFDEYQSKENGKHTLRGMQENARQGFWNGARAPFGYRIVEAERRGDKAKKRLDIHHGEAAMVRHIFELYRHGDGRSGPLGVKAIACHLNERGFHHGTGGRFSLKTVHDILTRTAYAGRHVFNRHDSKSKQAKPEDEWITVAVPVIIEPAVFDEVQSLLHSRNPKRMPPRVVSGPTLLTGLATCATCGGGMTIRTGKGGRYRYYT